MYFLKRYQSLTTLHILTKDIGVKSQDLEWGALDPAEHMRSKVSKWFVIYGRWYEGHEPTIAERSKEKLILQRYQNKVRL